MKNEIKNNLIQFIFGGNCTFNIFDNDEYLTYNITRKKTDDDSHIYWAQLVIGHQKIYFGYFKIENNRLTFKHNIKNDIMPDSYEANLLLSTIHMRNCLPGYIHVCHTGRCATCGRMLTDPKAIELGFGNKCWKKVKKYL